MKLMAIAIRALALLALAGCNQSEKGPSYQEL